MRVTKQTPELPPGPYRVIYADPPWDFKTYSEKGRDRCPDARHYETMNLDDIKAIPVGDVISSDALLFIWTTAPHLPKAFEVAAAWGFPEYKTMGFTWMKHSKADNTKPIMIGGYWTRGNAEFCLLFGTGKDQPNPERKSASVREAIWEARREHSRKPDCVYERIMELVDGPYLELFSRTNWPGWDTWGLESGTWEADKA